MGFGVFIHRSDSIYKDVPAERYQFPGQYLGRAKECVGGWIIYYEPRKVAETRGYFAIAKVQEIVPDPTAAGMYLALIELGSYLEFANPVAFAGNGRLVEQGLLNERGVVSGRAQAAVRPISPQDLRRIVDLGFADDGMVLPRSDDDLQLSGFREDQTPFEFETTRDRIAFVTSRVVRDRVFRRVVLRAYDERCAISGLKLINGGGRAEVAAAHIMPVEANGPDIISNGIALSGTVHWMFDRGLVSLSNDLEILVSRQANDPDSIKALINKTGRAIVPHRLGLRPHRQFLEWHREHCFKN